MIHPFCTLRHQLFTFLTVLRGLEVEKTKRCFILLYFSCKYRLVAQYRGGGTTGRRTGTVFRLDSNALLLLEL